MSDKIFSGLEDLGFDDISDVSLYKTDKEKGKRNDTDKKDEDPRNYLYDVTITCPVCGNIFQARTVKSSAYRRQKSDSDLHVQYSLINPYFYEVYLCNACGYSALKQDFDKIRDYQKEIIQKKIAVKWRGRRYPEVYNEDIAIERYKLSLLNNVVMEAKTSKKALNCLRIAWMYRLKEDDENEQLFLKEALEGFNEAYLSEDFPICGMDKFTMMYLIGELHRRTKNLNEANLWFSKVITSSAVPQKIKELARDQRDLIKEELEQPIEASEEAEEEQIKKAGFFSKLFK